MPRYNTTDTKNVDTNELDPCLAAKIRLAGNGKCRSSTTWVLITSLILLLTSIFILLFVLVTWFPKETCSDYLEAGNTESGVYKLKLNGVGEFYALCIMENNEAWMVLQQRQDGQEVFYNKTFEDYSLGFGDQASDHWLGLEKVRALLNNYKVEMRMEARGDRCDRKKGSLYLVGRYNFSISTRKEGYRLGIYRILSGNFTDPYSDISNSNGAEFATIDKNPNSMNCAELRKLGAWWHPPSCSFITLNGAYNVNKCHSWSGMQIYARERSRQGSHYKQSHHRPRFTRLALKVTGKV